MADRLIVFDHVNGEVRQTTLQDEGRRAARLETALRLIWGKSACFRTTDAECVLCEIFDLANHALEESR